LVRRSGVELLHSLHYTRPLFLPCASVVTFHDLTFFLFPQLHTRSKRLFFPAAMRISARKANALAAVSENTRQDAIRLLAVPPQKIFTTPLGVSEDFRPVRDASLSEAVRGRYNLPQRFILYVGLVEPRKNLPLLLSAYKKLEVLSKIPPLVIVGRLGWMYQEVFRQVEILQLKEKVLFAGYVPIADLPIVYNLADMFVYPSIYEGFGLPPLEAMACGTPVVTTAVSSMPEHVGDAGVLVPPQDEQALSQAMFEVLANQELRDQLAVKGPQQAARYTWKRTAQATLEVYQQAMRGP
jgi:glycosyltransferase involved in cell wall biosynthesis